MIGSKILYYLVIIPISRLPYGLLYLFSDFLYLVLFYLVGYRKKVVLQNLQNSFPEKSDKELKILRRKFYRHFTDLVVESLKNFTVSRENATKRMVASNPEVVNQYARNNQSVVIAGGHFNNWELWAVVCGIHLEHEVLGIYKRLSNKFFDEKMKESRGRYGIHMISTREVKILLENKDNDIIAPVFAIDQSPADPKSAYWTEFLNQETACYYGLEKYAKEKNLPVIYGHIVKVKRGFYELNYEVLVEDPSKVAYGAIIEKANELLEKDIKEQPQYWLWTHKRWKHNRPEDVELRTKVIR